MSNLHERSLVVVLFAILTKRLGGEVFITQADIDEVAFNQLEEEGLADGSLRFKLVETPHNT